jgi:isopentenyldiphosphate isomerase
MQRPTTDPQDELFDVLHPDGSPAGFTKPRRLVHRDGDWHAALHIWVGGADPERGPFVIFQRRSLTKDTFPGRLDVAVGGHVRAGETLADTAREAEEEIGLAIDLAALTRIGRRFVPLADGDLHDNEIQHVFAIRSDLPLNAYRLHPEEVDALVALPLGGARRLFADEADDADAFEQPREGEGRPISVHRSDFTPFAGDYPLAALDAMRDLLAGRRITPFEVRTAPDRDT